MFATDKFDEEVEKVAGEILENHQETMSRMKRLYDDGFMTTFSEGLLLEKAADTEISGTQDNLDQFDKKKFQ